MEKLNKDELFVLTDNMDIFTLINFSMVNKKIYLSIGEYIWKRILSRDFPKHVSTLKNSKEEYKLLFQLTNLEKEIKLGIGIYKLYQSKRLILTSNAIKNVPKEIGILKNLEYLSLSDNDLKVIPKEIRELSNLKTLIFSHNKLTEIPFGIHFLYNLERLDLSNNNLYWLPVGIEKHPSLKTLDISSNKTLEIDKKIENNKNLRIK